MSSSLSQFDSKSYFEGIFAEYSDELFRFCVTKVSSREESIDIVQEVFFKLWQYILSGTLPENPRALLYKMTRNKIIDRYRTNKHDTSLDDTESTTEFADESTDIALTIEQSYDSDQLLALLDTLHPTYKEILLLRYVDELSVSEIAVHLGISPNSVSIRLHRAIKELQELVRTQQ